MTNYERFLKLWEFYLQGLIQKNESLARYLMCAGLMVPEDCVPAGTLRAVLEFGAYTAAQDECVKPDWLEDDYLLPSFEDWNRIGDEIIETANQKTDGKLDALVEVVRSVVNSRP